MTDETKPNACRWWRQWQTVEQGIEHACRAQVDGASIRPPIAIGNNGIGKWPIVSGEGVVRTVDRAPPEV